MSTGQAQNKMLKWFVAEDNWLDNINDTGDPDIEPMELEEPSASTFLPYLERSHWWGQNLPFYGTLYGTPTQLDAIEKKLDQLIERTRNIEGRLSSLEKKLFLGDEQEVLHGAAELADPSDKVVVTRKRSATSSEAVVVKLDQETLRVCRENSLLEYIDPLNDKIHEIYHNVIQIRHRVLSFPDTPEREVVRFEIHLSGDPAQILADEKEFRSVFYEQVPEDRQDFFSFTYSVE